jgi:glycosyltransferase involved in cell wall biosynthesis
MSTRINPTFGGIKCFCHRLASGSKTAERRSMISSTRAANHSSIPVRVIWSELTGTVQGHSLLAIHLRDSGGLNSIGYKHTIGQRALVKAAAAFCKITKRRKWNFQEAAFALHCRVNPREYFHFIWGDDPVWTITRPRQAIVTVHQPVELWTETFWDNLSRFAGVITMAQREADHIQSRCPQLVTEFIPHGVNTTFWRPSEKRVEQGGRSPVIVCVGRYMRNFRMLARVATRVLKEHPTLTFRWLVNPDFRVSADIQAALPTERFEVLRNLSPEQLRELYRESTAMFMPYDNVTASNAIVEALSTGTPIVTTDVGGMLSYAEGGVDLVQNNDDDGAVHAINTLLADPNHRRKQSAAARRFAEQRMNWDYVVHRHLNFYQRIIRGETANAENRNTLEERAAAV